VNLRRHDWVYLEPAALPSFAACDETAGGWIRDRIARGVPLVATRQCVADGFVALGAVLPANLGRTRVACVVPERSVSRTRGPITVAEAGTVLPRATAAALDRFAAALAALGARAGIYGSTAWEFVTGDAYRHAGSDLDLICDVAPGDSLAACLAAFEDAARRVPVRIDGEIRFACDCAVAWRELADARRSGLDLVLAKGTRDVGLTSLRRMLAPSS
jgi:phosphoribosyl-dephospho-CoA transferase